MHDIGAWNNYKGIESDTPTFRTHLEEAGYACGVFGKTDYLSGKHTLQNRITAWYRDLALPVAEKDGPCMRVDDDEGERSASMLKHWRLIDQGCEWLEQQQANQPFFCYFGPNPPHPGGGYNTNRYWWNKIDHDAVTLPPQDECDHPVMAYMRLTKGCTSALSNETIRKMRHGYYARIAEVDAMLGQIISTLERTNHLEDTLIIYLSDHGDMQLEHGQYLKNALYEGSARVPLLVAGPDLQRDVIRNELVSLLDIFPTLLDWAGIPEASCPGFSLIPELRGGKNIKRASHVISEYHSNFQNTGSFMIRDGSWKLIEYVGFEPMLFHLKNDPHEIDNLASQNEEVVSELAGLLRKQCNPADIDRTAKAYDKRVMQSWRDEISDDAWEQALFEEFETWNRDYTKQLKQWLMT